MSESINTISFLDSEGNTRPELLDTEARKIAGKLGNHKISTNQLRKFFDEVKGYKTRLDKGADYKEIKPLIVMLKSKAKYASTKKKEMLGFYKFIEMSIDEIKKGGEVIEKKKFKAFCLFFEAIYGFADLKK